MLPALEKLHAWVCSLQVVLSSVQGGRLWGAQEDHGCTHLLSMGNQDPTHAVSPPATHVPVAEQHSSALPSTSFLHFTMTVFHFKGLLKPQSANHQDSTIPSFIAPLAPPSPQKSPPQTNQHTSNSPQWSSLKKGF